MRQKNPPSIEVGERIRKIREGMKLNREQFSELVDISVVFLGQIERAERSLSLKTLCKIVKATGVSSDYILFGNSVNNSNLDKINKLLSHCSEANIEYIYQMIHYSNLLFKDLK